MPGSIIQKSTDIIAKISRAILPLIGSGTLSQKVDRKIHVLNIGKMIIKMPFYKNSQLLFAACDILVFPSIKPHFARPVMEAAAMGKPSVASGLPGMDELIKDKETGFLVKPNNPESLSDSVSKMLEDPNLQDEMGENAYRYVRKKYDARIQVKRIMKMYDTILS